MTASNADRLVTGIGSRLSVEALLVGLCGVGRDEQELGDLRNGTVRRQVLKDLSFPLGERLKNGRVSKSGGH